jgi:hypothetical protein
MAFNKFYLNEKQRRNWKDMPCVFISHQKKDAYDCKVIADYLISVGINVYFDEYDEDLKISVQTEKPKEVVDAIKKGINDSTHMLCVISPNTLYSKWVPFEVGYGYDRTQLFALTLKGIKNEDLPDYIKAVPVIRDIYSINNFIEGFKNEVVLENRNIKLFSDYNHPLANVMNKIII